MNSLPRPRFRYSADPEEEKRLVELKTERDKIWRTAKEGSREYNKARAMFQQPQANVVGDSGLLEEQEGDGRKARMAVHILKEMGKTKKQFFMSVGFSRPHTPLRCPKKFLGLYDLDNIPEPEARPRKTGTSQPLPNASGGITTSSTVITNTLSRRLRQEKPSWHIMPALCL